MRGRAQGASENASIASWLRGKGTARGAAPLEEKAYGMGARDLVDQIHFGSINTNNGAKPGRSRGSMLLRAAPGFGENRVVEPIQRPVTPPSPERVATGLA